VVAPPLLFADFAAVPQKGTYHTGKFTRSVVKAAIPYEGEVIELVHAGQLMFTPKASDRKIL
jgi:hypothetical protein